MGKKSIGFLYLPTPAYENDKGKTFDIKNDMLRDLHTPQGIVEAQVVSP